MYAQLEKLVASFAKGEKAESVRRIASMHGTLKLFGQKLGTNGLELLTELLADRSYRLDLVTSRFHVVTVTTQSTGIVSSRLPAMQTRAMLKIVLDPWLCPNE